MGNAHTPLRFLQADRQFIRSARFALTSPRPFREYWGERGAIIATYPLLPKKILGPSTRVGIIEKASENE